MCGIIVIERRRDTDLELEDKNVEISKDFGSMYNESIRFSTEQGFNSRLRQLFHEIDKPGSPLLK